MARTPDRTPGASDEEETIYETNASPIGSVGSVSYDGTSFVMEDSVGSFDPRLGSLPLPTNAGQILYSADGVTFEIETPLLNEDGFIIFDNNDILVVAGS